MMTPRQTYHFSRFKLNEITDTDNLKTPSEIKKEKPIQHKLIRKLKEQEQEYRRRNIASGDASTLYKSNDTGKMVDKETKELIQKLQQKTNKKRKKISLDL